ncbi:hypothetical protein EV182_004273 [Spiromyces aspiralis]|uniref:Uncharacterized protein n=1 Tax=Spiromyces aspiralis TaxID=68401 RepID=A0ACC1HJ56_9FUNG|nr:hypothetical protein EV182_004273 [Spiromyces aspiralis]
MKYAQSSLEWMADSIGHKFDQTRTNPFDFRRVKLLQMRKEVEELVASTAASDGSGVAMLASFSSLETGHSREWLYEWARNEKNLVILTQRGPPGSLSRLLYEQWMAGLGSDSDEPNATVADRQGVTKLPLRKPERLDDLEIKRRVALEGRELEAWKLAEKNRREQENALMQRNHLMMIGDEDEYDDDDYMGDGVRSEDSDMEVELGNVKRNAAKAAMSSIGEMKSAGGVLPVAVTDAGDYRAAQNRKGRGLGGNSKMGSMFGVTEMDLEIDSLLTGKAFDLYVRDYNDPVLGAGEAGDGSFLMYPFIQRTRRADDYGELIDPLVYIQDSNERENDQEKEEEEVEGTDKTRAKRSGDSMILDGGEVIEDIEDELDDEYDPNIPSKYLSDTQTLKFDCRLAYVDYDGRVDSKAIGNIITLIAPHRLVLVHGSNDATEHLYQSCLANDQMTNQIFAPSNDEIVNVSSGSNTFTVKLTDNILNTMLMAAGFSTTVQGYDLAYMCGRLEYIEDSKVPVLNAPPSDVRGRWRDPLVVGSTKLTELKRALKANDIDSEFRGDGVLVCSNGNVAIQRTKDGKLKIQSNLSPLYYRVRDIIYNQVAVL